MCHIVSPRGCIALAAVAGLSACVTLPPNHPRSPQDPWESWNRGVYRVNDKLDRAIAKPVAKAYVRHVPSPIRTGVTQLLLEREHAGRDGERCFGGQVQGRRQRSRPLLMNSTFGVGGLFDPATSAGLDRNHADFGLTLGHWGVHPGPFFELPILGPSDVRDGPGKVLDTYLKADHLHPE